MLLRVIEVIFSSMNALLSNLVHRLLSHNSPLCPESPASTQHPPNAPQTLPHLETLLLRRRLSSCNSLLSIRVVEPAT